MESVGWVVPQPLSPASTQVDQLVPIARKFGASSLVLVETLKGSGGNAETRGFHSILAE